MGSIQLKSNSDYKTILVNMSDDGLIPKVVYHRFLHSLKSKNIEEFITSGEVIVRSILMKIFSRRKIKVKKNPGWNTILKTAWNKKIITNESIYAYLWVFAQSANALKNGDRIQAHEALIHVSVFFGFITEISEYIASLTTKSKSRFFLL